MDGTRRGGREQPWIQPSQRRFAICIPKAKSCEALNAARLTFKGYVGRRSKAGRPSGIWWKGCLSMVKMARLGAP